MSNHSRRKWVVPVERDGVAYGVTVLAETAEEARAVAEGVVEADGIDQWPFLASRPARRSCSECGRPDPGPWCDTCGWQR